MADERDRPLVPGPAPAPRSTTAPGTPETTHAPQSTPTPASAAPSGSVPGTGPGTSPSPAATSSPAGTGAPGALESREAGPGAHRRDSRTGRSRPSTLTTVRRRAVSAVATGVSVVTTVVVLVLAVHIVFVVFEANTANDLVRVTGERAHDLAWQFRDIFQPADPKAEVAVNYGLGALVYLIAGRIVVGLIRRLDGSADR